jgi:hypothetical protein
MSPPSVSSLAVLRVPAWVSSISRTGIHSVFRCSPRIARISSRSVVVFGVLVTNASFRVGRSTTR